ncbi:DoxX family protein [Methylovorus menthalis]|uniref:HvfX family Cu-binding RiPP maturation protein n=1 Tax=Methylovorus menthalis TaxID=1002227 RepID=UPI001E4F46D0|nr:DoxX family protein [Methylovorus menthalis]MCB4811801.1 DoxX family protein [Methylovorus menthalis]
MSNIMRFYQPFQHISNRIGDALPPLVLRLILAWEFGEAGYEKLMGSNWFADVSFPFPFSLLPPDVSWQIATWFELGGAVLLVLGLATRFVSLSLIILTIVAIAAVHWPAEWHSLSQLLTGYRIIDETGDGLGNYKLPLLYIVMFLPLLFRGAGSLSLDHLLVRRLFK